MDVRAPTHICKERPQAESVGSAEFVTQTVSLRGVYVVQRTRKQSVCVTDNPIHLGAHEQHQAISGLAHRRLHRLNLTMIRDLL